jgi:hypothetical protein
MRIEGCYNSEHKQTHSEDYCCLDDAMLASQTRGNADLSQFLSEEMDGTERYIHATDCVS